MTTTATNTAGRRTFSSADYLQRLMVELDRAAISRRIAQARTQAGIKQRELAEALVNPDTGHAYTWRAVQIWERGQKNKKGDHTWVVPFDQLEAIARICGVTQRWLLHGDGENEEPPSPVEVQADRLADAIERLTTVLERLDQRLAS